MIQTRPVLETLRDIAVRRSRNLPDEDFMLRSMWRVDYRAQPNDHERLMAYSFVIAQTIRQGCCYADFGSVLVDKTNDLIGQDARKARGASVEMDIAILDAVYGALPHRPHATVTINGDPAAKASKRAELIIDEVVNELTRCGGKRVANIGVMGNLVHQLQLRGIETTASDFDDELVNNGINGVQVQHGEHSPELVADCDVALICGETIANNTLGELIWVAREHRTRTVIFAVSGCYFAEEYCRTFGVDIVVSEPQPQYLFQGTSTVDIYRRRELG